MFQFDAEKAYRQGFQGIKNIHLIYFCVFLFLGLGIITLYSASYSFAQRFYLTGNYFVKRQLIFAAIGIVLFFTASFIKLDFLRKFSFFAALVTAVLCSLTLIPNVGVERYGATRWIEIGSFTYQPSELVKFVLPFYLAHLLDKKRENLDNFFSGILSPIIVTGVFFILIYIQNNFSTAVFIVFNAMIIFFLAGIRFRYFFAAIAMILPVSSLLVFTKTHRVWRLVSFLRPDWDPQGAGYQVNASRDAIISSGFLGKGIGEGTHKIASIPEVHSDFIFSAYVEETGFLGVLLFFILMVCFAYIGYKAAWKSEIVFNKLLAAGLTTMMVSQMLLNIAVVSGALPATGIPLPFFSAGGSSLITTMISAGLISNVVRNTNYAAKDIKNNFSNFSGGSNE
ncbi:MAG: putative lipid II flippase FtsW [Treponema sp.]|nr:putative lipid II flippase FtsW [Treponema sp.]MCL2250990.1 putative lipid II flippase FtsW [Treponema sp.]